MKKSQESSEHSNIKQNPVLNSVNKSEKQLHNSIQTKVDNNVATKQQKNSPDKQNQVNTLVEELPKVPPRKQINNIDADNSDACFKSPVTKPRNKIVVNDNFKETATEVADTQSDCIKHLMQQNMLIQQQMQTLQQVITMQLHANQSSILADNQQNNFFGQQYQLQSQIDKLPSSMSSDLPSANNKCVVQKQNKQLSPEIQNHFQINSDNQSPTKLESIKKLTQAQADQAVSHSEILYSASQKPTIQQSLISIPISESSSQSIMNLQTPPHLTNSINHVNEIKVNSFNPLKQNESYKNSLPVVTQINSCFKSSKNLIIKQSLVS